MKVSEELKEILRKEPKWHLEKHLKDYITVLEKRENKTRTLSQNSALHKGFQFISDQLNELGKDMKTVLKPSVDIWWSPTSVKEYLFRPIMKAHTTKESTTELEKLEVSECWDIMFKFLGEKHGVEYIPFPNNPTKDQDYHQASQELKGKIEYPDERANPTF